MVFVSMEQDDQLARTARYRIKYAPSKPPRRPISPPPPPRDPWRDEADDLLPSRSQGLRSGGMGRWRRLPRMLGGDPLLDITGMPGGDDNVAGPQVAQMPTEFTTSEPFHVTTECTEDETVDGAFRHNTSSNPVNRIGALAFENDSGDDSYHFREELDLWGEWIHDRERSRERSSSAGLLNRGETPEEPAEGGGSSGDTGHKQLMTPHARFYIEKGRTKCTIRFDPPVSGRFILLKMWSPRRDPLSNIDIQTVIVKGFAGPRYFPAIDLC